MGKLHVLCPPAPQVRDNMNCLLKALRTVLSLYIVWVLTKGQLPASQPNTDHLQMHPFPPSLGQRHLENDRCLSVNQGTTQLAQKSSTGEGLTNINVRKEDKERREPVCDRHRNQGFSLPNTPNSPYDPPMIWWVLKSPSCKHKGIAVAMQRSWGSELWRT